MDLLTSSHLLDCVDDAEPGGPERRGAAEMGRVELYLGPGVMAGYLVVNGARRDLPAGSRLHDGLFTWSPGAGGVGDYDLVFVRGEGQRAVKVTVEPLNGREERIAGYLDLPAPKATVTGSFRVAGWAADLGAWAGSGIGAVHVWAQRRDAPSAAVFLGAADLGGERPDVAAVLGAARGRAGWNLAARPLSPGVYDVTAYFWCTRTARFEDARTVTVTVK